MPRTTDRGGRDGGDRERERERPRHFSSRRQKKAAKRKGQWSVLTLLRWAVGNAEPRRVVFWIGRPGSILPRPPEDFGSAALNTIIQSSQRPKRERSSARVSRHEENCRGTNFHHRNNGGMRSPDRWRGLTELAREGGRRRDCTRSVIGLINFRAGCETIERRRRKSPNTRISLS